MSDREWHGETHTLIVRSARPPLPGDPIDDGELDYDIEHPASCEQEEAGYDEQTCMVWTCDVGEQARDGLEFSLRYSGTPITEPGTYQIQGWGTKTYVPDYGADEYDAGVCVVDPGAGEES